MGAAGDPSGGWGGHVRTGIVVWLDADTIVQRDVGELCEKLRQSGKTVGFVEP